MAFGSLGVTDVPVALFVSLVPENGIYSSEEHDTLSSAIPLLVSMWPIDCARPLEGFNTTPSNATLLVLLSVTSTESVMPNCVNHVRYKGDGEGKSGWE